MDLSKPVCERCSEPAIVHITGEDTPGSRVRHLCLDCANREDAAVRREERGFNHAAILGVTGLMILVISLSADVLRFGGNSGFGYKQIVGLVLAGGGVLVGSVIRIPTFVVIGVFTGGLTLLADFVHFGKSPGFGLEQMAGAVAGIIMVIVGGIMAGRR